MMRISSSIHGVTGITLTGVKYLYADKKCPVATLLIKTTEGVYSLDMFSDETSLSVFDIYQDGKLLLPQDNQPEKSA